MTLPYTAGAVTLIAGILVLIGWQFEIEILKSPLSNIVSMKANTAAAFLLAGLALIFLQRPGKATNILVRFCGSVIALIGLIFLAQHILGWDFGIDQILFREPEGTIGTLHPGLMAPSTALNFLLIGFTFLTITHQKKRSYFLIEFPPVFSLSVSVIGFVGYVTQLEELAGPAAYTKMAIHTTVIFIILCIGILFTAYRRQRAPVTIEQKIFAGLTAAATLIISIAFLSVSGITSLVQASNWIEHTQQVKNRLELVLSHVLEVQSADRGFIITGNDQYLISREKAVSELPALLHNIRFQTIDNPVRQRSFVPLERLIKKRLAFSDSVISTHRMKGEREARLLIASNDGNTLTDSIRTLIAQMNAEGDRLIQTKNEDEAYQANRNQFVIYLNLAVQVLLLWVIFFIVNRDMTAHRKAEEALQHSNTQLEAVNQDLDSFSHSVSHDLRAPLRHIDGFTQMLKNNYSDKLDEGGKKLLERILNATVTMNALIEDLMKLSQITQQPIKKENVNLSKIASDICESLKSSQPDRSAQFIVAENIRAIADEGLMGIVLENLLGNAWKYSNKKPNTRIEFGRSDMYGKESFFVRDNGAGFDSSTATQLFIPFKRLHSQSEFPGTGIGLSIVYRIIRRHGGKIWAESEVGKGATFYFTI